MGVSEGIGIFSEAVFISVIGGQSRKRLCGILRERTVPICMDGMSIMRIRECELRLVRS